MNEAHTKKTENIKVVIRIRPLSETESRETENVIQNVTSRMIMIKKKKYNFDRVFGPESSQMDIYEYVVAPMIPDVIEGYNCTIFAYGQTGTGKTYTICGGDSESEHDWKTDVTAGFIPRAAINIFDNIHLCKDAEYTVTVSFIELYNEEIYDLLSAQDNLPSLNVFNDTKGNVCIQGLKEVTVCNRKTIFDLLEKGNARRKFAPTLMNHHSSRSHTVFTISVHMRNFTGTQEEILKSGKLNLVDLAGSENIAKSGAKDIRALELSNINKSLLTLGRVIQTLADKKPTYIPYRNSKLTRILQDSLGGKTKTSMIATLSPAANSYEETISTLEYAQRTKDIKNCPQINQQVKKANLDVDLSSELENLRTRLDEARAQQAENGFYLDEQNYSEMVTEIKSNQDRIECYNETIKDLERNIREMEEVKKLKIKDVDNISESFEITKRELIKYEQSLQNLDENIKSEEGILKDLENKQTELCEVNTNLLKHTKEQSKVEEILHNKINNTFDLSAQNENEANKVIDKIFKFVEDVTMNIDELTENQTEITNQLRKVVLNMLMHKKSVLEICKQISGHVFQEPDNRTSSLFHMMPLMEKLLQEITMFISSFNSDSEKVIIGVDVGFQEVIKYLDETYEVVKTELQETKEDILNKLKTINEYKCVELTEAVQDISELIEQYELDKTTDEVKSWVPDCHQEWRNFDSEFVTELNHIKDCISKISEESDVYSVVNEFYPKTLDINQSIYQALKSHITLFHEKHKELLNSAFLLINTCLGRFLSNVNEFKVKLQIEMENFDKNRFEYIPNLVNLLTANENLMEQLNAFGSTMSTIDTQFADEQETVRTHSNAMIELIKESQFIADDFKRKIEHVQRGGDTPVCLPIPKVNYPFIKKERIDLLNEIGNISFNDSNASLECSLQENDLENK